MSKKFNPKDAVSAKLGKVYPIIDGTRYLWLNVKNINCKVSISSDDVPRLGTLVTGSRVTGLAYSGTMTIYKVDAVVDDMIQQMADTGVVPYFDIQTVNEDETAGNGRDVKLIKDCHIDGEIDIAKLDGEGSFLEQEVGFKANSVQPLEKFSNTTSIIEG